MKLWRWFNNRFVLPTPNANNAPDYVMYDGRWALELQGLVVQDGIGSLEYKITEGPYAGSLLRVFNSGQWAIFPVVNDATKSAA